MKGPSNLKTKMQISLICALNSQIFLPFWSLNIFPSFIIIITLKTCNMSTAFTGSLRTGFLYHFEEAITNYLLPRFFFS